jgi:hypothetical protein
MNTFYGMLAHQRGAGRRKNDSLSLVSPVLRYAKHTGCFFRLLSCLVKSQQRFPFGRATLLTVLIQGRAPACIRTFVAAAPPRVGGEARAAWYSDMISEKRTAAEGSPPAAGVVPMQCAAQLFPNFFSSNVAP